MPLAQPSS